MACYEYERAVREGYLVDYDAVTIKSDVRLKGIFLSEGEQVRLVDTETGAQQLDLLEDERQFDTTDIEEKITAPDSNRKIIRRRGACGYRPMGEVRRELQKWAGIPNIL